jgi:16S rRNA processing protein RimM
MRRSHGINGEIQMEVVTDHPENIRPEMEFFYGEDHTPVKLVSRRPHGDLLIAAFEEFDSRETVAQMTNKLLYIKRDALPPLPEDEYYHFQLVGLKALSENGENLGVLKEVIQTGSNDVYLVVTPEGKELLLPAREEVVLGVDLDKGEIRVRPPEWLD